LDRLPLWHSMPSDARPHSGLAANGREASIPSRSARAAAVPLVAAPDAPQRQGSSPVRPWRAGLPLALLRSSPRHKSPTPGTAHRAEPLMVCHEEACHGGGCKAACGCAPALECGSPSLREGFPAVLSLTARRETRCAHFVRYARTIATSQNTKRALRARGREPSVPRRRICRCRRTPARGFAALEPWQVAKPSQAARSEEARRSAG